MLAQAVLAKYSEARRDRGFSITSISPCEYETYIHYYDLDKTERVVDPVEMLRMEDGNYQEYECIEQLREAGFPIKYTGKNQLTLHINKITVMGHPDGLIYVDNNWDLLEVKAMSLDRFTAFRQRGLDAYPRIRCQVQLYMASDELRSIIDRCWTYAKHKDTCRPCDICEEKCLEYSNIVIESVVKIQQGKIPEKERSSLCAGCNHSTFCWGAEILDMSKVSVVDIPEVVEKWKLGKFYRDYGNLLNEEAREVLIEVLSDRDMMLVEDLKVQRIISKRFEISIDKFCQIFGTNRLPEVGVEKTIEQIRITEV